MRTRNSNFPNNSTVTIPRRRNRRRAPNVVEPELRTIVEVAPMAERTMEELLRAPTEGYGEAIVIPEINADHFEIKTNLLQLVQASPFHGFERENPHTHINNFKSITSTLRFRDVPNDMFQRRVVTPAMVKAVEESCVSCGSAHANYNCPNTDNNQSSVCAASEAFLKDDSISPEIDHADCDPEGDICLIENLLNNDPFQLPPMDLKEVTKAKSSIEEPPELELKYLPSYLEYAYLEGTDKLPMIITKFKKKIKKKPLKVNKSHKRVIAWKITDIKGIDPRFCTHKILMEEDYKPTVQSQRRVNPKIHEVIKKEVIKLLDVGMIYPISDNPWVSPIHCVPKKSGITVVANEENELHPTHLFTCIVYTDHSALEFLLSKQDAKPRLLRYSRGKRKPVGRPITITQVFPYEAVELSQPDGPNFKVNGHRVKHYFGGDIPSKVVPDLQIFSMDN
ncbi:hypothetical protein Tco_1560813 [Tanacetum coccineum]